MNKERLRSTIIAIVLFIAAVYAYTTFFLLADMEKNAQYEQKITELQKRLAELEEEIEKEGAKLQEEQRFFPFLETMQEEIDLKRLLDPYFVEVSVRYIDTKQDDHIVKKAYVVSGVVSDTKEFFRLLQEIEQKAYPMKLIFPLEFEKQGLYVAIRFGVELYTLVLPKDRDREDRNMSEVAGGF